MGSTINPAADASTRTPSTAGYRPPDQRTDDESAPAKKPEPKATSAEVPDTAIPKPFQFIATAGVRVDRAELHYDDQGNTFDYAGTTAAGFIQPGILWQASPNPQTAGYVQAQPTLGVAYAQNDESTTWFGQEAQTSNQNLPAVFGGQVYAGVQHDTSETSDLTPTRVSASTYAELQTMPAALPRTTRYSLNVGGKAQYEHAGLNGKYTEVKGAADGSWSQQPIESENASAAHAPVSNGVAVDADIAATHTVNDHGVHAEAWAHDETNKQTILDQTYANGEQEVAGLAQYQMPISSAASVALGGGYLREEAVSIYDVHSSQSIPFGAVRFVAASDTISTDNQVLIGASDYVTGDATGVLPYVAVRGETKLATGNLTLSYDVAQTGALDVDDASSVGARELGFGVTTSIPIHEVLAIDTGVKLKTGSSDITGIDATGGSGSVSVGLNPLAKHYKMIDSPVVINAAFQGGFMNATPRGDDLVNKQNSNSATLSVTGRI